MDGDVLLEALTSWAAVYIALFLPAVLMLTNFVFGSCFISEAIGASQHTGASLHTRHRILGRLCIAAVVVLLLWEYWVFFFAHRASGVAPTTASAERLAARCNPLYVLWDVADLLPDRLGSFDPSQLLACDWHDIAFHLLYGSFVLAYGAAVFSAPQVCASVAVGAAEDSGMDRGVSYCRKCAAHVDGMDHHCYLIGNCVGRTNRRIFLACLTSGIGNLAFLLYWCGAWAAHHSSPVIIFGLLLVVVSLTLLSALLLFQVVLVARGTTTLALIKRSRSTGSGLLRTFVDTLVGSREPIKRS